MFFLPHGYDFLLQSSVLKLLSQILYLLGPFAWNLHPFLTHLFRYRSPNASVEGSQVTNVLGSFSLLSWTTQCGIAWAISWNDCIF